MSETAFHPVVEKMKTLCEDNGVAYDVFVHEPVFTSEQAHAARPGFTLEEGTKAIIVRIKKRGGGKEFVMLALSGDAKFDTKKAKVACDANDLRFAREEEVAELTGDVEPGGIPPFGNLFHLPVIADSRIFSHERMVCNAGDRRVSLTVSTQAFKELVAPEVADIAAEC